VATDPVPIPLPGPPGGNAPSAGSVVAAAADDQPRFPAQLPREPFFDDKNRAFWFLQSVGWGGYFVLRTLSGVANAFGFAFVIHTLLLTATGYSMTLLMAAMFRRLIRLKPIITWAVTIVVVLIASACFSAIETWSHATFVRPGLRPQGIEFLSAIREVDRMFEDIRKFVNDWMPCFIRDNRNYLTVAIGCTGGRHRSVYFAERLAHHFMPTSQVLVRHRELDS